MDRFEKGRQLNELVDDSIAEMEQQLLEGHTEHFLETLEWWSRFHHYSFGNTILIRMQLPSARLCAGYRKWEKLGHQVREGEKALWIRGPLLKKIPDPVTGELVERLIGYIGVPVFDISQLVGEVEIPDPMRPATDEDWAFLYECWCRRLVMFHSITVTEQNLGSIYGTANPVRIRINERLPVSQKAPILLHELCHIVAKHHFEEKPLKQRELEAELSAYVLIRSLGADAPSTRDYLLSYQIEPGELKGNLETINKIVKQVREMLDFAYLTKEQVDEAA